MKLALAAVLLVSGIAHADPQGPPAQPRRGQMRQLLLQHFDRDHDGRLDPRERKQAAKQLRKLVHRLMRADMRQQRQRKLIQRFDRNRDGNVGPHEMPPDLADELRPLDRDGDGWLHGDELP
jgi:hypothetical protein